MIAESGQVIKPIIVVKIHYKLLYVIQVVKKIFLISNFLASTDIKVSGRTYVPIYNAASDWPCTFIHPVFLFSIFGSITDVITSKQQRSTAWT